MRARYLVTGLAVAFFLLPIGLRAVGVTAKPFENRTLAPKPSLDAGWDVFDQTTRFFTDRMPLREQAVRAHTWGSVHVFDTSPTWRAELITARSGTAALPGQGPPPPAEAPKGAKTPKTEPQTPGVIIANDGWLFLGEDLPNSCALAPLLDDLVPHMRRIVRKLERGGRRVVIAIAPDKSTIYADRVPRDTPQLDCATQTRARLWPALERAGDREILPTRAQLLAAQQRSRDLLYQRKDSHWNTAGAAVMVEGLLERLSDRVRLRPSEVVREPDGKYQGDLTTILGAPEDDTTPERSIRRAPGAARMPGRTVLVHDSYGGYVTELLRPYTERLEARSWSLEAPAVLAREIRGSDRVVLEVVERELSFVFAPNGLFDQIADRVNR